MVCLLRLRYIRQVADIRSKTHEGCRLSPVSPRGSRGAAAPLPSNVPENAQKCRGSSGPTFQQLRADAPAVVGRIH